jgi:hypothetical protein
MNGIKLSKILAGLGSALLLACIIWTARENIPVATSAACRDNLKTALESSKPEDDQGTLRIAGVYPKTISLGGQLCIVVAGVAAKPAAPATAPVPSTDITLYLNDVQSKLSVKANTVPGPQLLIYPFGQHTDASSEPAKFWRSLLAGKTENGTMRLSVGVSKTQSSSAAALAAEPIDFVVYKKEILALGIAAMFVLVAAFAVFGKYSTVLRDSPTVDANNRPNGTYSLGRTQMALWLILSVAGFVFLWLTFGFYVNVITAAMLVLLGINGVTGLAAILIDKPDPANPTPTRQTVGFWEDLVCDSEGAKLQRIQMIVWTGILAVIFAWNVLWNFVFVDFDTNLLLLMGIASSTYLGFKTQEKK